MTTYVLIYLIVAVVAMCVAHFYIYLDYQEKLEMSYPKPYKDVLVCDLVLCVVGALFWPVFPLVLLSLGVRKLARIYGKQSV